MELDRRRIIAISVIIVGVLVIWFIAVQLSRIGKTPVDVEVSPRDASVTIDGHGASTGTNYLTNGEYTFSASKQGYTTATQTVKISAENNYVALLPEPVSSDAIKEANSSSESSWAETISGIASSRSGAALANDNPIIKSLPYSDISGPFKIDFGYNHDNHDSLYLIVSYSTPDGRQKAIAWLKQNKVDITDMEIVFADFNNPTDTNRENHD